MAGIADEDKKDTQPTENDNNDSGKGGEQKKFTQEELDKILNERLKREQKKTDAKFQELEAKLAEASKKDTAEKTELEKMQELMAEMSKQNEARKKEVEQERFEKQIIKYANQYEVDVDKALKYLDPGKIELDEDGKMDFDKTFTEFAEFAGKVKKADTGNLGEQPKIPKTQKKALKDMTTAEKTDYISKYGLDEFKKLK